MTSKSLRSVAADANVLLSAVIGKAARRIFEGAPGLRVVTTQVTLAEVHRYLPMMAAKYGLDLEKLERDLKLLPLQVFSESQYRSRLAEAGRHLGKRDPDDVGLAALALKLEIPIWSNDRDFEELPLIAYSTARLLKILGL
ncbi:MAG: PIN domain-containing protein [Thermoanaerobaculia bacterium]|nr:PIN domain-containing protein [Thermoanaerobaculia bacterium]